LLPEPHRGRIAENRCDDKPTVALTIGLIALRGLTGDNGDNGENRETGAFFTFFSVTSCLISSKLQARAEIESIPLDAFADVEVVDGPRERLAWASSQASGKLTDDAKFTSSHCAPWFRRNHTGERSDLHARAGPGHLLQQKRA
jgi:hypothetical protein